MKFFFFHLMPWPYLPKDYERPGVGHLSQQLLRPGQGQRGLQPLSRRAGLRRGARLRRRVRQRAPPERLRHHAVAQPHRVDPGAADVAGEDRRRRQRAAALQPADARRRGVRHDRRDQRRPADRRHGRRRRAGVLLVSAQPDPRARAVPRGARPDHQGVDASPGPFELHRQALQASATSTRGRARCSSRTRRSGSPAPAAWRRSSSSPSDRYAYMGIPYFHYRRLRAQLLDLFREACAKEGYTADPSSSGWLVPIYVAETDEQAREEYEPHLWYFAHRLLEGITIAPPGYTQRQVGACAWCRRAATS